MKFTKEQLERGIAVVYGNQVSVCHTADEAAAAINGYKGRWGYLKVNKPTYDNLVTLFAGEEWGEPYALPWLKTTNCSDQFIKLYPALAPTLAEHQALYKAQCEREKAERIMKAEELKQRRLAEFNEEREGWYSVEIEIVVLSMDMGRRSYKTFSGKVIAKSKMDAYNKAQKQMSDYCITNGCYLERMDAWNAIGTNINYLGMMTDEGFSID